VRVFAEYAFEGEIVFWVEVTCHVFFICLFVLNVRQR
jgi:hypothetical protein